MNLKEQKGAILKLKNTVENLRALNVRSTIKKHKRVWKNAMQPWAHGIQKTTNALIGLFDDLQRLYDATELRTCKCNQVGKSK